MFEAIANVLQMIMQPCYDLCGNWWIAIALFTLITKIILFPMSLWCQKNSLIMVQLMPEINRLKVKYFGDKETIGEKQNALYKEKKYHPLLSSVPLLIQIIILLGLVDVIRSIADSGAPGTEFLGLVPCEDGGISWIMPLLAGLSAVIMGFAQNRINPLQREQSRAEKNLTNGLSIGLSFILGIFVSAGMAFYWICSNLSAILIQIICNIFMPPAKYIDYEDLEASKQELALLEGLDAEHKTRWWQDDPLKKREKEDYKRFMSITGKHIVFYSESSGFYKYFKGSIEYILAHSDTFIHYVTNDPNDQIFDIAQKCPRILPYYVSEKKSITLMMKLDCDICVLTLEDFNNYYIKRSYVRKDIEYVFFFHHMTSTHMPSRAAAFDGYDTIFCVGEHQIEEIRKREEMEGLEAKKLIEGGSPLLDSDIARYALLEDEENDKPTIMIAPGWQEDNILDSCIDTMLEALCARDWKIIVRPHPEYTKRFAAKWNALQERYVSETTKIVFEQDFSSDESLFTADILITDWSSVFCEFSFTTLKPSIFINTKMKVTNPDYEALGIVPTDISLRNEVGRSFDKDEMGKMALAIEEMLKTQTDWNKKIESARAKTIFNLNHSADTCGEWLLNEMLLRQSKRNSSDIEN